jgi:hypothetical protein
MFQRRRHAPLVRAVRGGLGGLSSRSGQHEMSTHYGRLVTTDDALMLFSDPIEAMDHLMK